MKTSSRIGWTAWALVPVGLIAFHFGPGQGLAARDQAVRLHTRAIDFETTATDLQAVAYAAHLEVIELRRASFLENGPDVSTELGEALEREELSYSDAAEAWQITADAFTTVEDAILLEDGADASSIRWAKARAQVRAGDIWGGAGEFELLLDELEDESELALATREELARAHYFGARLLRVNGEPAEDWRAEATKARQHFRYLAEQAAERGAASDVVRGLEDNVERVLDLEQLDLSEIQGTPFPKESPKSSSCKKPGNKPGSRISQRPPNKRDGRGASGAGEIGKGW